MFLILHQYSNAVGYPGPSIKHNLAIKPRESDLVILLDDTESGVSNQSELNL